ncbi:MAG: phosphoribosylglycinamide formyltransferase [Rhodospirillales bacterium]|jgi:phosphoribosylglycinamide formyltransferase 1|nr:phosphoribosylglycinamide formyltransferase [Rhodospirillales bacterium]MBT4007509.1 phosphoribosylglycinamide formyltransferase [Rhodospirillales bacterium]MBT5075695.1 phosphoribosylglycinamide formyltransferase [Rhodospirillales bacterium]MBT5113223.1 phosphoribosylglycinamide formyltransferase [Rhodospirillales bacterium]MBT5671856.1 phosphoribosylglycinamide formyltransferase [Rhodospirillales bacterium]
MARLKIGVLISGSGTNLQALLDAAGASDYPGEIKLVISNKADAHGLERARKAGVETRVIPHGDFPDRERFDDALDGALRDAGCELICLAGFMRILTDKFVTDWDERMLNIHPSLLPAFRGLDVHQRTLNAGVRITGCTVHFVQPELDAGPIIVQGAVPVRSQDDEKSLAARILAVEHRIYPLAVRLIGEGRVRVENGRVIIDDTDLAPNDAHLISPER